MLLGWYHLRRRPRMFLERAGNFSSFAGSHLLGTNLVRRKSLLGFILCWCVWLAPMLRAETYQLLDGTSVTGEVVLPARPEGVNIRTSPGTYQFVGWTNFTQAALQELVKNEKIAPFAEPYVEITEEDRLKKTEIGEKIIPPRLERPPNGSLLGALFGSSVGLCTLLLIYAANVYAGYEIAVVRAYPPVMVCTISAVVPIIGPVVFLCLPTRMETPAEAAAEESVQEPAGLEHGSMADVPTGMVSSTLHIAHPEAEAARPETQVFKRGQFTFNRRFIETKFSGFFGLVRRDAEKDLVFLLKSLRGEFVVNRITRIAANDMHVEIRKGAATSEVQLPFVEIQEIQLKHKDA